VAKQEAEERAKQAEQQVEQLKAQLRALGIDPDEIAGSSASQKT
jgi:hypothetical protein